MQMALRAGDHSASIKCTVSENAPEEKPLRATSFALHATRGFIRDQNARRKIMFALLVMAMLLLFVGSTFLTSILNPREHPVWTLFFWLTCVWLTLTAMLLALFDLLIVRAIARKAKRALRKEFSEAEDPNSRGEADGESF
jgi:small-conductance mechanosensitive channel